MTEGSYIRSVHRRLAVDVFRWKINANFTPGVPDAWYSGHKGDIWIEFKYLPLKTAPTRIRIKLTPQQREWLLNRKQENRNVAVIIGTPFGAFILTSQEDLKLGTIEVIDRQRYSVAGVASWIEGQTLGTH